MSTGFNIREKNFGSAFIGSNILRAAIHRPTASKPGPGWGTRYRVRSAVDTQYVVFILYIVWIYTALHYILGLYRCLLYIVPQRGINTLYIVGRNMLYFCTFQPLYIVSQPLSPASPPKNPTSCIYLSQPLYLVLQMCYIQYNPISCIYIIPTTIYCSYSAFSAPHPFAPTVSCVHGHLYYYILWRYYILYLLFILILYLVNSPTSPLSPSTPAVCTTVVQPQHSPQRGSQLATHVDLRDLRCLTVSCRPIQLHWSTYKNVISPILVYLVSILLFQPQHLVPSPPT